MYHCTVNTVNGPLWLCFRFWNIRIWKITKRRWSSWIINNCCSSSTICGIYGTITGFCMTSWPRIGRKSQNRKGIEPIYPRCTDFAHAHSQLIYLIKQVTVQQMLQRTLCFRAKTLVFNLKMKCWTHPKVELVDRMNNATLKSMTYMNDKTHWKTYKDIQATAATVRITVSTSWIKKTI